MKTCCECGTVRALADLIEVTHRRTSQRRYVCRVSLRAGCFRLGVGPSWVERIAAADQAAERVEFERRTAR